MSSSKESIFTKSATFNIAYEEESMEYKKGDLVYFEDYVQKGVGKFVAKIAHGFLIHSAQIVNGHRGYDEDNSDNWWFSEDGLKPFTKKVGQKYKALVGHWPFEEGEIVTLVSIEEDNISYYKGKYGIELLYDIDHERCQIEFYEDVKENKMYTLDDIKVGYMVKLRNGNLAHIVDTVSEEKYLTSERDAVELMEYNYGLTIDNREHDIVEVYGLTEHGTGAHKFELPDRELLWQREVPKKYYLRLRPVVGNMFRDLYVKQNWNTKAFILGGNTENHSFKTQFTQEDIDYLVKYGGLRLVTVEQIEVE